MQPDQHEFDAALAASLPITREELAEHLRSVLVDFNGLDTIAARQARQCIQRFDAQQQYLSRTSYRDRFVMDSGPPS
jgi:hypothetical protein